jgi:membrane-associated phospholipid phosphatase
MSGRRLHPGLALFVGLILRAGLGMAQEPTAVPPPSNSAVSENGRQVSWKLLVPNFLHDQKPIWLFPAHAVQGKHAKPALAFVLATAGLVALDPHDTPYFRRTTSFGDFNRTFSGRNTALATALVPLSAYAVGLARRDSYAQQTALLAGEAVADAEILTLVMKNVDRRLRPVEIPPDGDFAHTWFKGSGRFFSGRGSFPSGHTIAAFSVATVFARRYRRHRWVPWVAYGLAGLVGFSRVPLQSHFPSDVFAGAVFGYTISRYVVLRNE